MKIAVYAICRDEQDQAEAWLGNVAEADYVCVLDTGSRDGTWERLQAARATGLTRPGGGAGGRLLTAQQSFSPWRFDAARNASLTLVPDQAQLLVCVDLDERFTPGWAEVLRRQWDGRSRVQYPYIWSHQEDGSPGVCFLADKMHPPGYSWRHPVHECLYRQQGGAESRQVLQDLELHHWPDAAKSRSQYLPLLELAVAEEPDNDRMLHYLGREYMFQGRWGQALEALARHLNCPAARWDAERAASMRYLARCQLALGREEEAELWLKAAVYEAPQYREAYVELARLYERQGRWPACRRACRQALSIRRRPLSYICEAWAWNGGPEALLERSKYHERNAN